MTEPELNPYLSQRAAKVARNEAMLRSLGLFSDNSTIDQSESRVQRVKSKAKMMQQKSLRRSSRSRIPCRVSINSRPTKESSTSAVSTKARSARSISINAEDVVKRYLGVTMNATGKAHVMNAVSRTEGVSFNKYSGVQEWRNDALFLWINLGVSGDRINEFLGNGDKIIWFGSRCMHEESRVIQKLLRVTKAASRNRLEASNGVILWCRIYDATSKGFTPYICLGRIGYLSHDSKAHPLEFYFQLMDFEAIAAKDSDVIKKVVSAHVDN